MNTGKTKGYLWNTVWSFLRKLEIGLPRDLKRLVPESSKWKSSWVSTFFVVLLAMAMTWNWHRWLYVWRKHNTHTHTHLLSALNQNEILPFPQHGRKWNKLNAKRQLPRTLSPTWRLKQAGSIIVTPRNQGGWWGRMFRKLVRKGRANWIIAVLSAYVKYTALH